LTLLQIAAAAFMAGGLDKNSTGFAVSNAAIRGILVIEYLRTGKHISSTRTIVRPYSIGFSIAASIWLASAFVPAPMRFIMWIVGLAIDVVTPTVFTLRTSTGFAPNIYHLPGRFGTFTIIVLGISILAVVDGISEHNWTIQSILYTALGWQLPLVYGGFILIALMALRSEPFIIRKKWEFTFAGFTYICLHSARCSY
jgi:low temperature requirement protein LtrA